LKATAPIDLQQVVADSGRMVFLINWEERAANVELIVPLEKAPRQVREITTGKELAAAGAQVQIHTEVPAQAVRVYRIDY
jgi:ABC-type transporter Mla MlaB component